MSAPASTVRAPAHDDVCSLCGGSGHHPSQCPWRKAAMVMLSLVLCCGAASAQVDPRFVGEPARTADGKIARSMYQRALFVRMHPCPSTGQVSGACPGWAVDHPIPLACGGIDAPVNMQWLPLTIKSCAGDQCKDRWERRVYRTAFSC